MLNRSTARDRGDSEQNISDEKAMKNRSTGKQINQTFCFEPLEGRRMCSVTAMGATNGPPTSQTPDIFTAPKSPGPSPIPIPYPNIS
jgi:hypothetical protein